MSRKRMTLEDCNEVYRQAKRLYRIGMTPVNISRSLGLNDTKQLNLAFKRIGMGIPWGGKELVSTSGKRTRRDRTKKEMLHINMFNYAMSAIGGKDTSNINLQGL